MRATRASSRTHFTAENVQTTNDIEMLKVKEPVNGLCAKGALVLKVNYAPVKAALQTVPEELADSGFLTWFLQNLGYFAVNVEEGWGSWELHGNTLKKASFGFLRRSLRGAQKT